MNEDRTEAAKAPPTDEPGLTQHNTKTIRGEDDLSKHSGGAAPTYGPHGGSTDAEEEGAGGNRI